MRNVYCFRAVLLAATAACLTALLASLSSVASAAMIHARFLTADTTKHRATLTLVAGYTGAHSGLNFNGYAKGAMTVTIPVGYTVQVRFTNKSQSPHSAVITPYADRSGAKHPLAFPHASTPAPATGTAPGGTAQFTFTASKGGTYAIVCGFDAHAELGMWDVLKVVKQGSPGISFKK